LGWQKNLKEDFGNSLGDCSNFRVFHICHTVFDRARQTKEKLLNRRLLKMAELALKVSGLTKSYGNKVVLDNLSFTASMNDFSVICGKPGNGKSVLVRTIMGLEPVDSGSIIVRGQDVAKASAGERNIGYVPQSFALYPHYSVLENIEYPLVLSKASEATRKESVERVAELLRIKDLLGKKPEQLSGGQKQRVAIARGLAKATDVYVLDDPLVGLDFKLRERLIDDLRKTQEELKVSFVYMTSDPLEALSLAKTVMILAQGKIVQQDSLDVVYDVPNTIASMNSLGFPEANILPAELSGTTLKTILGSIKVKTDSSASKVVAGIRPEGFTVGKDANSFSCKVSLMENLGSEFAVYFTVDNTDLVTVVSRTDAQALSKLQASSVDISIKPEAVVLFDANSGERIGQGVSHV
jgi:ABC-type sugar transport system ATPase subunit